MSNPTERPHAWGDAVTKTGKPIGRPKQPLCSKCGRLKRNGIVCVKCEQERNLERTIKRREARKAERIALAEAGAPLPEGRHPAFGQGPREPWRPFLTNREEIAVRRMGYSGARFPKACQGSGYRCSDMERRPTLEGGLRWHCGHYGVDLGTPGNFMPLRCDECVEKKGK